MTDYTPKPEHKFTFGLWTVGSVGRDPFGAPVRQAKSPADLVYLLGEVGAYGVNFHDNDLIPIDGIEETVRMPMKSKTSRLGFIREKLSYGMLEGYSILTSI